MRHFSKILMFLSSSVITLSGCYDSVLDMPAEKLSGDKVHSQMYVSLNYDDAVFAGDANVSNRRFIVEARDAENTENVLERKEIVYNTASTLTEGFQRLPIVFELDQKKYIVSVWMDYIETGTDKDFYYDTEDLSKISMITPESAADVHRDALASTQTIDLTEQALGAEFAVNAQLVSPVAKVSLIAQDWLNFLQDWDDAAKTAQVTINFASEMPTSYDALSNTSAVSTIEEKSLPINVPENPETTGKTTITELYLLGGMESANFSVNILSAEGVTLYNDNYTISIETGKNNRIEESFLTGTDTPIKEIIFDGSGTDENPFKIKTTDDLYRLMELINVDNDKDYQAVSYLQTEELDLTGKENIAIGTTEFPFKGIYDGNGKQIISPIYGTESNNNCGLFGVIENATLQNIRVKGFSYNTKLTNYANAGGICALSKGNSNILNCESNIVDNTAFNGNLVGGICGKVESGTIQIKACKVSGSQENGQIKAGKGKTDISSVIGGIVGLVSSDSECEIEDSYVSLLKVTNNTAGTSTDRLDYIGGICGKAEGTVKVTNSYINTQTFISGSTKAVAGPIIANDITGTNSSITDCYYIYISKEAYGNKSVNGSGTCCNADGNAIEQDNKATDRGYINGAKSFVNKPADSFESNWPTWDTSATSWGNIGAFNETATDAIFPTLKWENEQ